jgi:V/A-type H+-transporting ATPase subunit E
MAVDDILNRIRAEAEEAAGRVMSGAQNEAEEIAEKARKGVEAERERLLGRARQRADEERNRIVTMARLSARRELLEERESILSMGRDEYRGLMRAFLDDTVDPGGAEVVIDVDEKRIDQPFLDQVSAELGRGVLTLAKDRRVIGGGFVLRSGRTETNCTLETILRDARECLEPDVAAILFAAENKD